MTCLDSKAQHTGLGVMRSSTESVRALWIPLVDLAAPGPQQPERQQPQTALHLAEHAPFPTLPLLLRWLVLDGPMQGKWPGLLAGILRSSSKPKVSISCASGSPLS